MIILPILPHERVFTHGRVKRGWVEYHWRAWHEFESLFDGTSPPIKGWVTMPESPGLGYTPKTGIIQDFAVE